MRQSRNRRGGWILAAAAAALVLGCTTATPYQPLETRGSAAGGYAEQRLEDNRYRVAFIGNSLTSRDRVENYLLYRAAELALQEGYDGFTIVRRDTERDVETRVIPDAFGRYGHWRPYWRYYGPYGWRTWDPWFDGRFWADEVDVRQVERYEATAEIVLFRGSRPGDLQSFDARQVVENLRPVVEPPR